jgi:hypothetical protein
MTIWQIPDSENMQIVVPINDYHDAVGFINYFIGFITQ